MKPHNAIGDIWIMDRDPRANTTFEGRFMAIDAETLAWLEDDPDYSFEDAGNVAVWCVVGDDPIALEQEAIDFFTSMEGLPVPPETA